MDATHPTIAASEPEMTALVEASSRDPEANPPRDNAPTSS
jgi:hypothetical protein